MNAMITAPLEPLTLPESKRLIELERKIEVGLKTFVEVGLALSEIHDSRLYKIEHPTFEDYCKSKWNLSRRSGYDLIATSEAAKNVQDLAQTPITREQARPLTKLPPEQHPVAWARAVEIAGGEQPTAKQVEVAVLEVLPPLAEPEKKKRNPNIRFFHRVKISLSGEIISLEKIEKEGSENDSYISLFVTSESSIIYSLKTIRKTSFAANVCKAMRNLIREEARP